MAKQTKEIKKIAEEIDTFDDMLTALVEILEEKGILSQEEWEKRIREKIERKKGFKGYRKIQFSEDKAEAISKTEQKERINNLLIEKHGLHIEDWVSLDELLDSSLTYSENLGIVREHLGRLVNEYPQEFIDRIGRVAFERLKTEFL